METTVDSLNTDSKFLISKFTRQRYIYAQNALDAEVATQHFPQVSLVNALNNTAILTPNLDKQIIVVNVPAAGSVRIRSPKNGCTEFLMVMKTPANVTITAFPSGTIMPQVAVAQVIHSIRFIWDVINLRWRSVRTQ